MTHGHQISKKILVFQPIRCINKLFVPELIQNHAQESVFTRAIIR
jgi:hypothetical protein